MTRTLGFLASQRGGQWLIRCHIGQITPEEAKVIANIFTGNQTATDSAYSEGLHVAGEKYIATTVSVDDNVVMVRQVWAESL